jgi:hypothetical protein
MDHERNELVGKQADKEKKIKAQAKQRPSNYGRQDKPRMSITPVNSTNFFDVVL